MIDLKKLICGDESAAVKKLQQERDQLRDDYTKLRIGYGTLHGNNLICENNLQRKQDEIKELNEKLISAENKPAQVVVSNLLDKNFPAILKLKTDKKETIYKSGFGIRYKNQNWFYKFSFVTEPIYVGGVAWLYVLDEAYFHKGMAAIDVFNMALRIVQEKYGYKTDTDLYGIGDSWAPPLLTQLFKAGDCEDLTAFVVNIFLTYEQVYGAFPDSYCAIAAGYLRGICHAFPVLIKISSTNMNDHYIGESTLNSYSPARTFDACKNDYSITLGIIGHPTKDNKDGGFVIKPEYYFWQTTGGDTMEKSKKRPVMGGNEKEKKKVLKEIWGGSNKK